MSINVRTLIVIRATLLKAVQLLDAELKMQEGGKVSCHHFDRVELTTMGKGPRKFMCLSEDCKARFSEEVEDERASTFRKSGGLSRGTGVPETTIKH